MFSLRSRAARWTHRISRIGLVDRLLERKYRNAIARHRPFVPALDGLDRDIAAGLTRDGVFVTSLEALGLPGSEGIRQAGLALASDFAGEANRSAAAGTQFLMVPPAATLAHPELFVWGLHDRLLNIVEAYLGLPAAYDGMTILYTVADGKEQATRRWHRDREDRRMVKIAVYCHDVDEAGGPFEIDRGGQSAQSPPDGANVATCVGKAGTVIFADTARCLHRGRPAIRRDRSAIFYSYFSRRPRNPFFCGRSGLSRTQTDWLAAELPQRQRGAVLWHDALPALVRILPRHPI